MSLDPMNTSYSSPQMERSSNRKCCGSNGSLKQPITGCPGSAIYLPLSGADTLDTVHLEILGRD